MSAISSTLIYVILTDRPWSFFHVLHVRFGLKGPSPMLLAGHRTCPINVENHPFKNYDPERFHDDLHLIPFDIAYVFEDIDDIYWAWSYLLSSLLDVHEPIKRRTANREQVPFMTLELLEAIRKRNEFSKAPLQQVQVSVRLRQVQDSAKCCIFIEA